MCTNPMRMVAFPAFCSAAQTVSTGFCGVHGWTYDALEHLPRKRTALVGVEVRNDERREVDSVISSYSCGHI